jgi:hypothetical protein
MITAPIGGIIRSPLETKRLITATYTESRKGSLTGQSFSNIYPNLKLNKPILSLHQRDTPICELAMYVELQLFDIIPSYPK